MHSFMFMCIGDCAPSESKFIPRERLITILILPALDFIIFLLACNSTVLSPFAPSLLNPITSFDPNFRLYFSRGLADFSSSTHTTVYLNPYPIFMNSHHIFFSSHTSMFVPYIFSYYYRHHELFTHSVPRYLFLCSLHSLRPFLSFFYQP